MPEESTETTISGSDTLIPPQEPASSHCQLLNKNHYPMQPVVRKAIIFKDKNTITYPKDSLGPFMVALKKDNIGNKHATLVGELLFKSSIEGIKQIHKSNKDMILIEFDKSDNANKLVNNQSKLPYENVSCFIPLKYTTRRFIVNNIPTELEIDSIGEYLSSKYKHIISVRRIFKKGEDNNLIPTSKLDILWEGVTPPDFLFIFYSRCPVSPYIYNVVKCTNCLLFGHRADFNGNLVCKGKKRCTKCSEHHSAQDICPNPVKCFHCSNDHLTFSPSCPEMTKQKVIKNLMATHNASFKEAKELAETQNKESLKVKLTERIMAIQQKTLLGQPVNFEELKISDFPQLHNKYDSLPNESNMEVDEQNPQYSLKQLRQTYSETVSSPSPTRKKAKLSNDYDPEMPSDEWLQGYLDSLPKDLAVKPTLATIKGFWPSVINNVNLRAGQPSLADPPVGNHKSTTQALTTQPLTATTPNLNQPKQPVNTTPKAQMTPPKTMVTRSDLSKTSISKINSNLNPKLPSQSQTSSLTSPSNSKPNN